MASENDKPSNGAGAHGIFIPDDQGYSPEDFVVPTFYQPHLEKILLPNGMIKDRIEKLAELIYADTKEGFAGEQVFLLCVLKGAAPFFSLLCQALRDLVKRDPSNLQRPVYLEEYIHSESYIGFNSSGVCKLENNTSVKERLKQAKRIYIVEDLIDTGLTIRTLMDFLKTEIGCKDVQLVIAFQKRVDGVNAPTPHYLGFSIPPVFAVGFGLGLDQLFRDLEHVGTLKESYIKEYLG